MSALGYRFVRACALLVPLAPACCEEETCERSDVVAAVRDTAGDAVSDCGDTSTRSHAEIRGCIDEATENGRGYFFTWEGEFQHTFIATKDGEHYDIVVDPDRRTAERFRCPRISTSDPIPSCDHDETVRDGVVCESGSCGGGIASSP